MKKNISQIFQYLGHLLLLMSDKIYLEPARQSEIIKENRYKSWIKAGGDNKYRYNYQLNSDSVVFDLGGYEGKWTSEIYSMYGCTIYVFEPVKKFYAYIKKKYEKNHKIHVFNFGLSNELKTINLTLDDASTTEFSPKKNFIEGRLTNASDFFKRYKIYFIDLMKINIEGGEYDLMDHLIESGWISKIGNIQIQFHDFVPNSKKRMESIRKKLSLTHKPTYQFEYVWGNWKLNKKG